MTKILTTDTLASLQAEATDSPRRRQHLNLHKIFTDPCQRFLNALYRDSYIRPHRHTLEPKEELLVAISGVFALCLFDDNGVLTKVTSFATEAYWHAGMAFAVSVSPTAWHTVVALTDEAVLLETKAGPYNSDAAKELAPWSPPETDTGAARAYLDVLRQAAVAADQRLDQLALSARPERM